MGGGITCMKVTLIIINLFFALIGLALLVVGLIIRFGNQIVNKYFGEFSDKIKSIASSFGASSGTIQVDKLLSPVAIVLIVIGLFLAAIAIVGFLGACCGKREMLIIYIVALILVTLGLIVVCVMFFTHYFDKKAKTFLLSYISNGYKDIDDYSLTGIVLNFVMLKMQCCGIDNYSNFNGSSTWVNKRNYTYSGTTVILTLVTPLSCCVTTGTFPNVQFKDNYCATVFNSTVNNYNIGCWSKIEDDIKSIRYIAAGVFVGIFVFAVGCLIFAACVLKAQKNKENKVA